MSGPLPLLGLRAFVEVGRSGSMKLAARRIGVTPGAVSQQVKALEARLGLSLFDRLNREVRLTPDGKRLFGETSAAFDRIEGALEAFGTDRTLRRPAVIVSTTGSFAATWLVPRLGRFTEQHPGVEVEILTSSELVTIGAGPGCADIAIRHGLGDWPNLNSRHLLQPRLVPVGSPALLAKGPPIREPADCLRYRLLHDAQGADWSLWLQAMGADHRDPRAAMGMRLPDTTLLTRAAIAGQGLALLRDTYVADEVADGRLAVALEAPWPAHFAYYVVTRPGWERRRPHVARFKDWLETEAAV